MDIEEFITQRDEAVDQVASVRELTNLSKNVGMNVITSLIPTLIMIIVIVCIIRKVKKNKGNSTKQTNNSKFNSEEKQKVKDYKIDSWAEFIKIAVISGICGYIGYLLGAKTDECFVYVWFAAGLPWGYNVMDKVIDDISEIYFALSSSTLWLVMVIIKFALALMLGAIIMPIKIVISLYHIMQAHQLSKEVNSAESFVEQNKEEIINEAKEMPDIKVKEKGNELEKMKTLKELMDEGIITQEEFESKKKEILNKM